MAKADLRSGRWRYGWAYFFSRFNKNKKRLFIPMPFSNMIGQARWFNPFLKAIQEDLRSKLSESEFAFWGDKIGFGPLFHEIMAPTMHNVNPGKIVYVMRDFEKMDTTTGPSQKSKLFVPKIASAFNYAVGSHAYIDLEDNMLFSNRCPIATPEGMWTGDHGEASGATVTNGGETCCNESYDAAFQAELARLCSEKGVEYRLLSSFGNGDDGISLFELLDVSQFDVFAELIRSAAAYAAKLLGFIIQAEKWDIHLGTYGKYCQYLIDYDGSLLRAMYPAALILNSICNPETEYAKAEWDKDYRDNDILMKLMNGRELPYFHDLIDYVDNGMKYRLLGRTETETRRILSKYERYAKLRSTTREGFNRYSLSTDWHDNPVVSYLLSKRKYHI